MRTRSQTQKSSNSRNREKGMFHHSNLEISKKMDSKKLKQEESKKETVKKGKKDQSMVKKRIKKIPSGKEEQKVAKRQKIKEHEESSFSEASTIKVPNLIKNLGRRSFQQPLSKIPKLDDSA
jgi:hypothetical protein